MKASTPNANSRADVLIVGGGVIGLAIARELKLRGVRNVTVLERGEFGKEASWAAGGILAPQIEADAADDFFRLACASRNLYPAFARTLQDATGIDVYFDQTGTLYLGFDEVEEIELRRRYEWQASAGLNVEWLNGDEARQLEPNISLNTRCAVLFPDDWQVENRKLIEALVKANLELGVELVGDSEVRAVQVAGDRVFGVETTNGIVSSSTIVIASGAWTSAIRVPVTDSAPVKIEPVRGQMLCFKTEPPMTRHVTYSPRGYLVPRRDGRLLAGSTSEHAGFDKRVTMEGAESIKSMAIEIAPVLESATVVDSWAGFRPHSPDDLPVLGPAGDIEGLFYATGHYRNGILLAPITAGILADMIVGSNRSAWLEIFSPNRFGLAAAGR